MWTKWKIIALTEVRTILIRPESVIKYYKFELQSSSFIVVVESPSSSIYAQSQMLSS